MVSKLEVIEVSGCFFLKKNRQVVLNSVGVRFSATTRVEICLDEDF